MAVYCVFFGLNRECADLAELQSYKSQTPQQCLQPENVLLHPELGEDMQVAVSSSSRNGNRWWCMQRYTGMPFSKLAAVMCVVTTDFPG